MAPYLRFQPNILALLPIFSVATAAPAAETTSTSASLPTTAAYFVSGTTETFSRVTLTATGTGEGVIIVKETDTAYIFDSIIEKTGNTTSSEDSSFTDLNAAIGVETNGTVYISNSKIITNGLSANGLHTYEDGSAAYLENVFVHAEGDGTHGIYTAGGSIYGKNLVVKTFDGKGSAIATDRGGGLIAVEDCEVYTYGSLSALVYSTGNITTTDLTGVSDIAPAACIDGSNSFAFTNPCIKSGTQNHGVFQIVSTADSSSLDNTAYAYVTGGSVEETNGTYGLIFAADIQAFVYLTDVDISIKSRILANISADTEFGDSPYNGANATIYLTDVDVDGDVYVDDLSGVELYLVNSHWTGALNPEKTNGTGAVYLDERSSWTLSGDSKGKLLGEKKMAERMHRGKYHLKG